MFPPRLASLLLLSGLLALADAVAEPVPAFQLVRYDEDWSVLADGVERPGVPAFKYLALGDDPGRYLSLGGEWRERFDANDTPRYGVGTRPDDFLLQRLLLHADLHLGDRLRLFAQVGREDALGKTGPGPSDIDRGDLANLFVDVRAEDARSWDLRLGRQELLFNSVQRFVSVREGPNVRQSFDGARLRWTGAGLQVDLFATRPVAYSPGAFDDRPDHAQSFSGVHVAKTQGDSQDEVYLFRLIRDDAVYHGRHARESRDTLGFRLARRDTPWDLDIETLLQRGRFGDLDIRAWAAAASAGWTLSSAGSPRLSLEIDAGSGGRDEGRIDTFQPLFPKGAYFSEAGIYSWANSVVVRPALRVAPMPSLSLQASMLQRFRTCVDDAVYTQPAQPISATLTNRERRVGTSLQLDGSWKASHSTTVTLELARNFAGPALRRAGGETGNAATAIWQLKF